MSEADERKPRLFAVKDPQSGPRVPTPESGHDPVGQLLIGDASEVLPDLTSDYAEQVRLALLDPPYNTSGEFHHYADREKSSHWLNERESHFLDIRKLLRPDGSMWIHLDDSEMHYCKVLLDGIMGRDNFVGTIVWQKTLSRENRTDLSTSQEYLLVYAKEKQRFAATRNLLPLGPEQLARYSNPDDDPRGPWTSGDMTAKAGPGRRRAQFYKVETPSGRIVEPAPGMCWRYTRERFEELRADDRITFGTDGSNMPRLKRFLAETQGGLVPTTWWDGRDVGTSDSAKKELRTLFPNLIPFETPKPETLTQRVIHIASDPGDVVLDCYAGSGTTPAVAHKMRRNWIAVEREQRTVDEFLIPRLQRVVDGEDDGGVTPDVGWAGGGRFQYTVIAESSDEYLAM